MSINIPSSPLPLLLPTSNNNNNNSNNNSNTNNSISLLKSNSKSNILNYFYPISNNDISKNNYNYNGLDKLVIPSTPDPIIDYDIKNKKNNEEIKIKEDNDSKDNKNSEDKEVKDVKSDKEEIVKPDRTISSRTFSNQSIHNNIRNATPIIDYDIDKPSLYSSSFNNNYKCYNYIGRIPSISINDRKNIDNIEISQSFISNNNEIEDSVLLSQPQTKSIIQPNQILKDLPNITNLINDHCLFPSDRFTSSSISDFNNYKFNSFVYSTKGTVRSCNQDRYSQDLYSKCLINGVYDGHGILGDNAAYLASLNLPIFINEIFNDNKIESIADLDKVVKYLFNSFEKIQLLLLEVAISQQFALSNITKFPFDYGTTACVTIIPKIESSIKNLLIANIGDSKCILIERLMSNKRKTTSSFSFRVSYLCKIHDINEIECDRILNSNGLIYYTGNNTKDCRMYPSNLTLDKAKESKLTVNLSHSLGHLILSNYGLSSLPDIYKLELDSDNFNLLVYNQTKESFVKSSLKSKFYSGEFLTETNVCPRGYLFDRYIVLGSDGLWDALNDQEIIYEFNNVETNIEIVTKNLILRSDEKWKATKIGDNITVNVIKLN